VEFYAVPGGRGSGYIARTMPLSLIVALLLQLQLQLPAPTGYVNDFANVIDPAARAAMQAVIDQVRAASGGEIVVVTLPDIGGRASIDAARDIGRQWKVGAQGAAGDARRNTGVVLLLVPGAHPGDGKAQLAIASGSGAEGFVTDALAGRIRDEIGRQSVSTGSYAAGLVAGVQLLGAAYAREFGFKLTGGEASLPEEEPQAAPPGGRMTLGRLIFLALLFIAVGTLGSLGRRRGRGSGLLSGMIIGSMFGGGGRGGWGGGGFGGGGFGGFGGGGGFSGGGASGGF
jgi:uncharacterized protein